MRIPRTLKLLINTYYAFQRMGWLHEANPEKWRQKPPKGWKDKMLDEIAREARARGMAFSATAGRMCLQRGKQVFECDDPLPLWNEKDEAHGQA